MSNPEPSRQPVRILVVDDEARVRKDMVSILKKRGYAVMAPEGAGQVLVKKAKRCPAHSARMWPSLVST